jgi:hypothetical protein
VLADFFSSHPLPQGLVLARGPVAAQMYEFSYTENPPNCVGGIRELFYCLVIASLFTVNVDFIRFKFVVLAKY